MREIRENGRAVTRKTEEREMGSLRERERESRDRGRNRKRLNWNFRRKKMKF